MRLYKKLILLALALLPLSGTAQVKQMKNPYGYLFCHMSRKGEWTAFALSRDGENWHDLNDGKEIYDTERLSEIEGGARDAYIARSHNGKGFVMVTTDMCNRKSHCWSNYGINLLKSDDLIHWSAVTFDFRKGPGFFCDSAAPDFYKDYSKIRRVWAPQVVWDKKYIWPDGKRGGYFIYYSILNSKEDRYDRMFYSYADRSFTKITKPRLLFDWGYATIDADIVWVDADQSWHMMIKKEGGRRGIFPTQSKSLTGPWPQPNENDFISFEKNKQCEGASAFQIAGEKGWRVGYVEYSSHPTKYRICQADENLQNFHSPKDIKGVSDPQHGSFLPLSKKEYLRLEKYWTQARKK